MKTCRSKKKPYSEVECITALMMTALASGMECGPEVQTGTNWLEFSSQGPVLHHPSCQVENQSTLRVVRKTTRTWPHGGCAWGTFLAFGFTSTVSICLFLWQVIEVEILRNLKFFHF